MTYSIEAYQGVAKQRAENERHGFGEGEVIDADYEIISEPKMIEVTKNDQ